MGEHRSLPFAAALLPLADHDACPLELSVISYALWNYLDAPETGAAFAALGRFFCIRMGG